MVAGIELNQQHKGRNPNFAYKLKTNLFLCLAWVKFIVLFVSFEGYSLAWSPLVWIVMKMIKGTIILIRNILTIPWIFFHFQVLSIFLIHLDTLRNINRSKLLFFRLSCPFIISSSVCLCICCILAWPSVVALTGGRGVLEDMSPLRI